MNYDFHKNYKLKCKREMYISKGLTGLVNTGNKCYINSILQCLSNTLSLTDFFLSGNYNDDLKNNSKIAMLYGSIIMNMWSENTIIKTRSFLVNVKDKYSINSNSQEDSHEFLLYLLNELHKGFKYEIEVVIKGNVQNESDKLMKESLEKWVKFYERDYSIIINNFYGMNFSRIICNNKCENNVINYEPFNVISLPTTREDSDIYGCLDKYFSKNEVVTTWKCDKCNSLGCTKSNTIWSLPNYVIIHLKRTSDRLSKLDNTIVFPIDNLDLTKYILPEKKDPNNYIYSLYSVNYHSGNINSGHYWSYCKNLDNKWYCFDDENVSRVTIEQVINKNAYILFYYRKFI
jgi:ubiquitin C-terminal hydrolase